LPGAATGATRAPLEREWALDGRLECGERGAINHPRMSVLRITLAQEHSLRP
jgi:hypothetical protein